jgi:hypothetical protein
MNKYLKSEVLNYFERVKKNMKERDQKTKQKIENLPFHEKIEETHDDRVMTKFKKQLHQ